VNKKKMSFFLKRKRRLILFILANDKNVIGEKVKVSIQCLITINKKKIMKRKEFFLCTYKVAFDVN
jgi:hypothetical protein